MTDEYINKKDVIDLGVMMQTHLWTREQTYNAIFCLPSADVVQVVRCKDCVSFRYVDNGITYCAPMGIEMQPTDFCSYGERKDND